MSRKRLIGTAMGLGAAMLMSPAAEAGDLDAGSAHEVSPVTVKAKGPLAEDTGLAVAPGPVRDLAQAVSVVSQAELVDQNVASLQQALRNVPGITISIGEGGTLNGDQFRIRGQDASNDIYVDGLRDFGVYTRDSFDTQEVQVLKGPSGALFGRGTTGGAINTLSKAPEMSDRLDVTGSVGNGDYYRGTVDLNHAFSDTTALRLNLMGDSNGVVGRDVVRSHRWGAAAAFGAGLGTGASVTVNYLHLHDDRIPDYGVTIVQPPGSLIALPAPSYGVGVKRSTFLGYSTDRDRTTADVFTVELKHDPKPWLKLESDSRLGVYSRYFQYTTVDRCDQTAATFYCADNLFDHDPATVPNAFIGGGGPYRQNAWGVQNISTARAAFHIGFLRDQLILGTDASYQKNDKTFFAYTLPPGVTARTLIPRDLLNPGVTPPAGYNVFLPTAANISCVGTAACTTAALGGAPALTNATAATVLTSNGDSTDIGVFATDRLWLTPQWSLTGSLRFDRYKADLDIITAAGKPTSLESTSNMVNPRVSLVYEPSDRQTFYVSYGRSATPQGTSIVGTATALAATTADLEPEISQTYEVGAKISPLGRLSLTASVFDVRKNNAKQTDPDTGFVEAQSGQKQDVRGFELGASGHLTEAWEVDGGYTYLDAKIKEDFSCTTTAPIVCKPNPYTIGQPVVLVPKQSASLWTTYELKGIAPGLKVGGGVTYQSRMMLGYTIAGTAPNPTGLSKIAEAPWNLSLDAMASYETAHWRIALNGFNLTDRLNYSSVFSNRAAPAPGRGVILTLGARF